MRYKMFVPYGGWLAGHDGLEELLLRMKIPRETLGDDNISNDQKQAIDNS